MKIYNIISSSRIYYFIQNIYVFKRSRKNSKKPNKKMLESRAFFDVNKDRVNNITSWLIDDASKDCYIKMIDFRCNSNTANFPESDMKSEYFYNEYFTYGNDEVYVDCGAYIGETVTEFKKAMKRFKGDYNKIVAFEPEVFNHNVLAQNHKDIIAIRAGVWSRDDTLYFGNRGPRTSTITSDKSEEDCTRVTATTSVDEELATSSREPMWEDIAVSVPVRSIDGCPDCRDVTFLKMDIEGSEMEALEGAKETIAAYKPKLAICIYHSDEDMIRIPEWIHDNFPEYKLFVRQHIKYSTGETVLYGFVD